MSAIGIARWKWLVIIASVIGAILTLSGVGLFLLVRLTMSID